jgi:hypothetical protein
VRREVLIRLLDDRSASVDLVLQPHRLLVTGSLPFSGSSLGGLHSVSCQDLYLNRSAVKSGLLLSTISKGTTLEFSDLKLKLESREFFGLDSIEHEDFLGLSFDGLVSEAMCKVPTIEVPYSNQVEVLSD